MKVITIFGRLTKDGEVRETSRGKFVTFSVAVNDGYKENQTTIYFDVAYNKEGIAPYLTKGKQVTVNGDFKTTVHNDKTYLKIQANRVELGGGETRQRDMTVDEFIKVDRQVGLNQERLQNRMAEGSKTEYTQTANDQRKAVEVEDFDDEIPF